VRRLSFLREHREELIEFAGRGLRIEEAVEESKGQE
jgi:hypothetical protein